jgi:hypothetical protein
MGVQQWDAEMSAFDDYLSASAESAKPSFDAYVGASPVPASAAGSAGAAAVQPAAGQPVPVTNGFLTGVGDVAKGTTQGIVHGLSWLADKVAPDSQFAKDAHAALPQMQQAIDQQNAAYETQRAANGQSGIDLSRLAGTAVGTAPTMLMGGGTSLPARMAISALQGGAGAAMMPTTNISPEQSYAGQKLEQMAVGGALGAAAPALYQGAKSVGSGVWNALKPVVQPGKFVGQGLSGALSPQDAAAVAQNIRGAQQFVPGSVPTTAQAGANPVLVQTEKALANDSPDFRTALLNRTIGNNDARWQALMGVAQDQTTLDAAKQARTAAAQPLYDAAHQSTANVGPAFMRYAQIPEMQDAMQRANQLASLDAAVGRGVSPVWPTPNSKAINGAALDYTSRALGDMVSEAQRAGNNSKAGALAALKNHVDSWTQQYIPGVQQAKAAYAAGSVPVNTMEVGQQIANGLGTRAMNAGGAPEIQMMPYRAALAKAMNNGNAADFGIDANALGTLQGIGQDLQRATISNSVRSPGSDTAYNLAANGWLARNLYGPTFNGATGIGKAVAAGGALLAGHPLAAGGALAASNKLGQSVGAKLQGKLGGYLLDPDTLLPYLDARAAAPSQAVQNAIAQRLLQYSRPAIVNGLSSGLINANQ